MDIFFTNPTNFEQLIILGNGTLLFEIDSQQELNISFVKTKNHNKLYWDIFINSENTKKTIYNLIEYIESNNKFFQLDCECIGKCNILTFVKADNNIYIERYTSIGESKYNKWKLNQLIISKQKLLNLLNKLKIQVDMYKNKGE